MPLIRFGFALVLLASACAPASVSRVHDTQTIHDPNATRVWLIHERDGTQESVVVCDLAMYQAGRELCTTWTPNGGQYSTAVPASPPVASQPKPASIAPPRLEP
jgi:hypothetical protein